MPADRINCPVTLWWTPERFGEVDSQIVFATPNSC